MQYYRGQFKPDGHEKNLHAIPVLEKLTVDKLYFKMLSAEYFT